MGVAAHGYAESSREAEVGQLEFPCSYSIDLRGQNIKSAPSDTFAVDEEVLWFQIAMKDTVEVAVCDSLQQLPQEPLNDALRGTHGEHAGNP